MRPMGLVSCSGGRTTACEPRTAVWKQRGPDLNHSKRSHQHKTKQGKNWSHVRHRREPRGLHPGRLSGCVRRPEHPSTHADPDRRKQRSGNETRGVVEGREQVHGRARTRTRRRMKQRAKETRKCSTRYRRLRRSGTPRINALTAVQRLEAKRD